MFWLECGIIQLLIHCSWECIIVQLLWKVFIWWHKEHQLLSWNGDFAGVSGNKKGERTFGNDDACISIVVMASYVTNITLHILTMYSLTCVKP